MSTAGEAERDPSIKELLHRALDLPPQERRAFLAARIPPGGTLDGAIELLDGVEELDGFLEAPFSEPAKPFEPALPERIGAYEIERVLGWGSMGVVYLARQARPARQVAVKLLRLDSPGSDTLERFLREADVLARLSHPGIATVYESGAVDVGTGEQPWFAMEYVEGTPLTAYAESEQLDRRARVRLVLDAARAVEHAHERGVVHRDLKPENVLVGPGARVCVLDFGVARVVELAAEGGFSTLTATGQVIGTLAYMAPEQARGGGAGPAADQFALGALLYELLTGELPLAVRGRLPHEALRLIAEGDWTPATRHDPTLAGDLEAILASALAPEANRRYASVRELADDLERWLDGRPVLARSPSRLDGIARQLRRHPLLVAGVALTLVLLGAVLAVAVQANLGRDREGDVALLFSDGALHDALVTEADELWPYGGTTVGEFDGWLHSAQDLLGRLGEHRAAAAALADRATPGDTRVGSVLGGDWLVQQSTDLIEALEELAAPGGPLESLRARREEAKTLRARSIDDQRQAWAGVAERVAADPRFDGLQLPPQLGLVPLGPDPQSGLEEFGVLGTGEMPVRSAATEPIVPRVGASIVLVLIPAGEHRIGMQNTDPEGENYMSPTLPWDSNQGPPFRVRLDPFLLGKFELTQDQWVRYTGSNPSDFEMGSQMLGDDIGPLNPVESLSWEQATDLVERFGLVLPTEAQWEVAARGAPSSPVPGSRPLDLVGHVSWGAHKQGPDVLESVPEDGIYPHMPVGSLLPSSYGLHDILGNVYEFCLDGYKVKYHALEHRAGDGLVLADGGGDVSRRGGCWDMTLSQHTIYRRAAKRFDGRDAATGVRPARKLVLTNLPN